GRLPVSPPCDQHSPPPYLRHDLKMSAPSARLITPVLAPPPATSTVISDDKSAGGHRGQCRYCRHRSCRGGLGAAATRLGACRRGGCELSLLRVRRASIPESVQAEPADASALRNDARRGTRRLRPDARNCRRYSRGHRQREPPRPCRSPDTPGDHHRT